MPYTLSHPAATLPIWRMSDKKLRLAALVIGSVSPDFLYFWPGLDRGQFTHTLPGLVLLCLPLSWFTLWLFDRWGRKGLQTMLPSSWRLACPPAPLRPFASTVAAILLGALSHVIWDSFTHRSGLVVRTFPVLTTPLLVEYFSRLTIYRLLQHGSTIVGLIVLAVPCWRWMRSQPPVPWAELGKRALLFGTFLAGIGVLNGLRYLHKGFGQFLAGGGVGVTFAVAITFLFLGMRPQMAHLLDSIVLTSSSRRRRRVEAVE